LRLNLGFQFALFAAFSVLFVTGALWLCADQMKVTVDTGETWQAIAANLLMVHGGVAMITLMFLGALFPLHIRLGWRSRRNLVTGAAMASFNAVLVVTAFGLYYTGSEVLRPWMSIVHTGFGLCLPFLFIIHVFAGKRTA
jgi:hypothetical protein